MVSGFLIVRQEADDGDIRLFLDKDYYDIFFMQGRIIEALRRMYFLFYLNGFEAGQAENGSGGEP